MKASAPKTVRILISSPSDVGEERDGAKRVVEGLQRRYPGAKLEAVLWEELALPATASFQETIDFLLEREPVDIAVFILWSRLGSPLGDAITRPDGTPYRSGTEREFDLMLTAFERSGRKRPVILAYVREDDAGFKRRLAASPKSELPGLIEQQQLAESFIIEQFHDAEGRNVRAYQTYREPVGFQQRFRVHLRRALADLLDAEFVATWEGEPYRGLQTFDIEHAPIFHGRDEETCELLQRLREQEHAGLNDAAVEFDALPLLEFTLSELYRQRYESRQLLTYAAYVELGGVEGAIGKRADEIYDSLPTSAQDALDEVLPMLISVDVSGEQAAVRRRATLGALTSTTARRMLTERLIAERFLTTDRDGSTPVASLAHEALLRSWDRIVVWTQFNRESLRLRARVEQQQERWERENRDDSLLLADGLPLDEGNQLLEQATELLSDSTKEYIENSIAHQEAKAGKGRRFRKVVFSVIAALTTTLIGGGIVAWNVNQQNKADILVARLLDVDASGLLRAIQDVAPYRGRARAALVLAYTASEDGSRAKLHAGLVLNEQNGSQLPYLKEQLLQVSAPQFSSVRRLLEPFKDDLRSEYWEIACNSAEASDRRFQAACALAEFDTHDARWANADLVAFVANQLVGVPPSELGYWRDSLRPVRAKLAPALGVLFRDRQASERARSFASDVLGDYLSDDSIALFELLMDAEPEQFAGLFGALAEHVDDAIAMLDEEVKQSFDSASNLPLESSVSLAKRKANAAAALARLARTEMILPALRVSDNPESLTQFVHRCRAQGVNPRQLLSCLELAYRNRKALVGEARRREDSIVFGLLLALGEFELNEVPGDLRESTVAKLGRWYGEDPSAAIHGATGWLLRQWGMDELVLQVDRRPIPFDATYEREWFVIKITPEIKRTLLVRLLGAKPPEPMYFTMIVVPPGEYKIGTAENVRGRYDDERLHHVRLTRPVAILDREVSRGEFQAYSGRNISKMEFAPTMTHPVVAQTWYESVEFCRWLTIQAGLSEDEQAYRDPSVLDKVMFPRDDETGHPKDWPVRLGVRGFRLPTETEWEIAARAGMRTVYSFGDDGSLVGKYGWVQSNSGDRPQLGKALRPNLRGLFDMQGNLNEWCHDWYGPYPFGGVPDNPRGVPLGIRRVVRGGSWDGRDSNSRVALRFSSQATDQSTNMGLRVAFEPRVEVSDNQQAEDATAPE